MSKGFFAADWPSLRLLVAYPDAARTNDGVINMCKRYYDPIRWTNIADRVKNLLLDGDDIVEKGSNPRRFILPVEMWQLVITIGALQVTHAGCAAPRNVAEVLSARFFVGRDAGISSGPYAFASPPLTLIEEICARSLDELLRDVSRLAAAVKADPAVCPFLLYLPSEWVYPEHKQASWAAAIRAGFSPRRFLIPASPSLVNRLLSAFADVAAERIILHFANVAFSDAGLDGSVRRAALSDAADLVRGVASSASSSIAAASRAAAGAPHVRWIHHHYKCARGIKRHGGAAGAGASAAASAAAAAEEEEDSDDDSESGSDSEHDHAVSAMGVDIAVAQHKGRRPDVHTGCPFQVCVTVVPGASLALLEFEGEHNHPNCARLLPLPPEVAPFLRQSALSAAVVNAPVQLNKWLGSLGRQRLKGSTAILLQGAQKISRAALKLPGRQGREVIEYASPARGSVVSRGLPSVPAHGGGGMSCSSSDDQCDDDLDRELEELINRSGGCVCGRARDAVDGPSVRCAGAICSLNSFCHMSCLGPAARMRAEAALAADSAAGSAAAGAPVPFFCPSCHIGSAVAAASEASAAAAATASASAAALGAAGGGGGAAASVAPGDTEPLSEYELCLAVSGLLTVYSRSRRTISVRELNHLRSHMFLQRRDGETIPEHTLKYMRKAVADGPVTGHLVQLHVSTLKETGAVNELWFSWTTQSMLDALARLRGVFRVQISDFTGGLAGCGSHLGSVHGIVPAAAGRGIPICFYIYLAGAGIVGEKTRAFVAFQRFVHAVGARVTELGGEVELGMTIDMTDKDLTAIGARHSVNITRLHSAEANAELVAICSVLARAGAGATDAETHAAVALAKSMPLYRSIGGSWDDFVGRAATPSGASTVAAAAPGAAGASASAGASAASAAPPPAASASSVVLPPQHARLELTMETLLEQFPQLAPPPTSPSFVSASAADAELPPPPPPPPLPPPAELLGLLSEDALLEYARIWPGIARVILFVLQQCVERLRAAPDAGHWNEIAACLLWILPFAAEGGPLQRYLERYALRFSLLCLFHVYQALERAANDKKNLPTPEVRRAALAGFRAVIGGKQSIAEYEAEFTPLLHEADAPRSVGGSFAWFVYLRKNWLDDDCWSLVSSSCRRFLARYSIDTSNWCEGTWNVIKQHWAQLMASNNVVELIRILTGSLLADDGPDAGSMSLFAQTLMTIDQTIAGECPAGDNYKRSLVHRGLRVLQATIGSSIRVVGNAALGDIELGRDTAAGWRWSIPLPAGSPPPAHALSSQRIFYLGYNTRKERWNLRLDDWQRESDERVSAGASLAELAGADDRASASAADGAARAAHAQQIASAVLLAPSRVDFPTLRSVGDSRLRASIVSFFSAWMPPALLAALAALAPAPDAIALSALERVRLASSVLDVIRAHGMPVLRRGDFSGRGGVPHIGIVYLVCVTMSAQCWLDEYERVFVRSEFISKATGKELDAGFFVLLAEMLPLARALVASDMSGSARCELPLTSFYVGQELRDAMSGSRFGRAGEHGSRSGNDNIRELYCVRSSDGGARGADSIYVEPLCDCSRGERVRVVRCFLALLPPRERVVDLAEDALMCFFTALRLPLFNNTPGTARRWLHPSYRGEPPLLEETLEHLLAQRGAAALAARTATEGVSYFVARSLRAVELRLINGQHVRRVADGDALMPVLPELVVSAAGSASASTGRVFSQQQCIDAVLGSRHQRVVRVRLWSGGCTCEGGYCSGPICAYLLLARMYVAKRPSLRVRLPDRDLELLHMGLPSSSSLGAPGGGPRLSTGAARAQLEGSARGAKATVVAAAATALARPAAEVAADLSVDLLALGTVLPHLPPEKVSALHNALRTAMAGTGVWELFQERHAGGGGASFAGAHMQVARLKTRTEVESAAKNRRVLLDVDHPLARLETALRATQNLPPVIPDDALWRAEVVRRGGSATASAASSLSARGYPAAASAPALTFSPAAAAAALPTVDAITAMQLGGGGAAARDPPSVSGFVAAAGGASAAAAVSTQAASSGQKRARADLHPSSSDHS